MASAQPTDARAPTPPRSARRVMTEIFRDVSVGGIASLVSGIVILGFGGRLVMFLSRVLHPEAIGRFTENGNEVGFFTVDGTLGLLIFGGIFGGLAAAPVWVVMKPWIPKRSAMVGVGAVAIGGFQLVTSDNPDFDILEGPAVDLGMLLALMFVFGVGVYLFDRFLDRRLPRGDRTGQIVFYGAVTAVGLLIVPLGLVFQFLPSFADHTQSPVWTAVFVCATALVTLWWWVGRARGLTEPTPIQRRLGSGFAAAAALVGLLHLTLEITRIL
ncbi:MAG: hypothetical protein ABW021_07340 [Acidimicrobiia bacterium]